MKRKILLTVFVLLLCLSGCTGGKVPNKKRGTNYKYDIVDFLDISAFGENGNGYLEIYPLDIAAQDFETDEDYIAVKKDLNAINPEYITGGLNRNSSIKVWKGKEEAANLSNGDMVTIEFKYSKNKLFSDLNIESYDYVITELEELDELDLFDEDLVTFYTDGEKVNYILHKGVIEDDIADHLIYTVTPYDSEMEVGKTIMKITASMDQEYLEENNCVDTAMYLARNRWKAKYETEVVLNHKAASVDFGSIAPEAVRDALYNRIWTEEPNLGAICSLQKTEAQTRSEDSYTVVYRCVQEGENRYYSRALKMVMVDNKFDFYDISYAQAIKEEFSYSPIQSGKVILQFTEAPKGE